MNAVVTLSSIPHRPPFLFVDEIIEASKHRIVTTWSADGSAPFFQGHYPGNPLVPGALLCECCFQAGALLMAHRMSGDGASNGFPVITRIQDARFKRIVRPGESLRIEVTLDDELEGALFFTGRVTVEGQVALRVSFACILAPTQDAPP